MEITSEDEFEELQDPEQLQPNPHLLEVRHDASRIHTDTNLYRVQIIEVDNPTQLGIVENQYYYIKVYKNQTLMFPSDSIKRRYSDFDMLFQIIFRDYKGKILPAFPEKGLVSYVKTKVTLVKDTQYVHDRMRMVQRFFTLILNDPEFNCQHCEETRKFLSESEFSLFKKGEKEKSTSYITSSWNKLKNYIKIGKENKYKCIEEQLIENKKMFEELYDQAKTMLSLLQEEEKECINYSNLGFKFNKYQQYTERTNKITKKQKNKNTEMLEELTFELFCQNEDFLMALKVIESIEEFRNNEENYKSLKKVEDSFREEQPRFQDKKKKQYHVLRERFVKILQEIQKIDESF